MGNEFFNCFPCAEACVIKSQHDIVVTSKSLSVELIRRGKKERGKRRKMGRTQRRRRGTWGEEKRGATKKPRRLRVAVPPSYLYFVLLPNFVLLFMIFSSLSCFYSSSWFSTLLVSMLSCLRRPSFFPVLLRTSSFPHFMRTGVFLAKLPARHDRWLPHRRMDDFECTTDSVLPEASVLLYDTGIAVRFHPCCNMLQLPMVRLDRSGEISVRSRSVEIVERWREMVISDATAVLFCRLYRNSKLTSMAHIMESGCPSPCRDRDQQFGPLCGGTVWEASEVSCWMGCSLGPLRRSGHAAVS